MMMVEGTQNLRNSALPQIFIYLVLSERGVSWEDASSPQVKSLLRVQLHVYSFIWGEKEASASALLNHRLSMWLIQPHVQRNSSASITCVTSESSILSENQLFFFALLGYKMRVLCVTWLTSVSLCLSRPGDKGLSVLRCVLCVCGCEGEQRNCGPENAMLMRKSVMSEGANKRHQCNWCRRWETCGAWKNVDTSRGGRINSLMSHTF